MVRKMAYFYMVFIGIIGVAMATENDVLCVMRKSTECSAEVLKGNNFTQYVVCNMQPLLMECIQRKVNAECQLELLAPVMAKVVSMLNEVCKEGTDLNEDYNECKECLESFLSKPNSCISAEDQELLIRGLQEHNESLVLEFHRKNCKKLETLKECTYDNMRTACGSKAEAFLRAINEPAIEFQKKVCGLYAEAD